jgi:hypothetical protein
MVFFLQYFHDLVFVLDYAYAPLLQLRRNGSLKHSRWHDYFGYWQSGYGSSCSRGIGAYHFLITELLTKLYLIPAFAAAAFATASHAAQTLIILIAGSLSYLLLISKKTKPLNEPYKRN